MARFAVPPAAQPPPVYMCFPTGLAPASAPAPAPSHFTGAIYAKRDDDRPAPGNRVNGRLAKVDDGSGVLMAEDMTTFHVFNSGIHPERPNFKQNMDFKVQVADSHWSVKYLTRRLGGWEKHHQEEHQIAIEEWHELGNGNFRRGSLIHYDSAKANCTLTEMGWGPNRGKAGRQPPVWVVLYP